MIYVLYTRLPELIFIDSPMFGYWRCFAPEASKHSKKVNIYRCNICGRSSGTTCYLQWILSIRNDTTYYNTLSVMFRLSQCRLVLNFHPLGRPGNTSISCYVQLLRELKSQRHIKNSRLRAHFILTMFVTDRSLHIRLILSLYFFEFQLSSNHHCWCWIINRCICLQFHFKCVHQ